MWKEQELLNSHGNSIKYGQEIFKLLLVLLEQKELAVNQYIANKDSYCLSSVSVHFKTGLASWQGCWAYIPAMLALEGSWQKCWTDTVLRYPKGTSSPTPGFSL